MLFRTIQLRKLQILAHYFNNNQSIYFLDINDEGDLFIIYVLDPSDDNRIIRAFNGTYKECVSYIKEMPLINIKKGA